jgi:hypothetical protein
MQDSDDPILQKVRIGQKAAILEYFKMRGDDPLIVAHVENWGDSFYRRVNATLNGRRLGAKAQEAYPPIKISGTDSLFSVRNKKPAKRWNATRAEGLLAI